MGSKETNGAWPVLAVIGSSAGAAALMDAKARQKSLETGVPWIVHPATGRVLPWPGEPRTLSLEEIPGGYRLELPAGSDPEPYGRAAPPRTDPDDRGAMAPAGVADAAPGIVAALGAVIAERRRTMPEGSYTTHLFEKGLDKIRKKTGEEAVELLLADKGEDIVYEAADLVYHLLVLLEASGLSWADVEAELERRHGS